MEFQEIYETVMRRCHHNPTTETDLRTEVKKWINQRYEKVWYTLSGNDPAFGRARATLTTTACYIVGTVSVTKGSTAIIGTDTVWTAGMVGRKFKLTTWAESYDIAAYVSPTQLTLLQSMTAEADDELNYTIYQDEITLPAGCGEIVKINNPVTSQVLGKVGISELREKQGHWYLSDSITDYALLTDLKIVVYPIPINVVNLPLDYTGNFTALEDVDDEPLLPVGSHGILITGGMSDLKDYSDDESGSNKFEMIFSGELSKLIFKSACKTDKLLIRPVSYRQR